MKSYYALFLIFFLNISIGFSQDKNDVLLTIDGESVYVSEFKRVYNKNLDLVKEESQKTIDGYMDLFIDYKLKVAEAYDQKLNEQSSYIKEFSKYQEQLSRNYIYDNNVTDDLAREAYDRSLEEIEAEHVLITLKYEDLPKDTLVAYNTISKIRERAIKGEDFKELAKRYSEEPGAEERAGYLGYFSVFAMVYPFENMAYNTAKGEISEIVRTQFGYHIVHVLNKREKAPEISVSHIMISDKDDDARTFKPNERIREIWNLLEQGESFDKLAKQFSDDKNSAIKGGKLNPFSRGTLRSKAFESYAFNLKEPGKISKPFLTQFGWHIVKLDEIHPIQSFEQRKEYLEKRVKQGNRSKVVTNAINAKIKEKYGFKAGGTFKEDFMAYLPDEALKRKYHYDSLPPIAEKVIFTIGDKDVSYEAFARYIESRQRRLAQYRQKELLINDMYAEFEMIELKNYFRDRLEYENEDYAAIISEYRNGLLIFDLMNANIWQKAKTDSIGLKKFYDKTRDSYQWEKRVNAIMVSAITREIAEQALELLSEGKTEAEIKEALNTNKKVTAIVTSGKYEVTNRQLPTGFIAEKGISKIYNSEGSFVVVNVTEVIPPGPKKFEEVRGKVLNNYQNQLEVEWMNSLRSKFKVNVNKKVLKRVKRELRS